MMLVAESVITFSIGNVSSGALVGAKCFSTDVIRVCGLELFIDIIILVFFFFS